MTDFPVHLSPLSPAHFHDVIALGNLVHGDGYLDATTMERYYQQGIRNGINAGVVAHIQHQLVGFRLVFAPGQWQIDAWCSPALWQVAPDVVGYFKCNTVAPNCQGRGIGGLLLQQSIRQLRLQGAQAGLAHLWMESPGNAAVRYFSKHGGQLVKVHPDKWNLDSKTGYTCVRCGNDCHCHAAEMLILFGAEAEK